VATNRRISEFPEIAGTIIDEPDLLTLVHVFEVDPVLRNKKITFSGFKDYLNQYYIQGSGNFPSGDLTVFGDLVVSGTTSLVGATTANQVTASGLGTFSGIFVENNLETSGTISGGTITGISGQFENLTSVSGVFTSNLSGTTANFTAVQAGSITGNTAGFTTVTGTTVTGTSVLGSVITGVTGIFTSELSGETVTGTTANFTSGNFVNLFANNLSFGGDQTISGNFTVLSGLFISGQSYFASDISVTGDITGSTLAITTPSGATAAIVCSGVVSGGTGGFVIQGPLVILP